MDEIELDQVQTTEYQEIWSEIVKHRRMADYLERGLYTALRDNYGIDLAVEDWELDAAGRRLRRKA